MPPRPRRTTRTIRRRNRKLEWADFQLDSQSNIGFTTIVDVLSTFAALPGASTAAATVARVHARLWVTSAQTAGDGISTGWIVDQVNETIASPGVANSTAHILSTVFQPNADWMLYQQWNARPTQYSQEKGFLEFDIRSRRRLKEIGDTLLFVFDNRNAAANVTWSLHCRSLLMMP